MVGVSAQTVWRWEGGGTIPEPARRLLEQVIDGSGGASERSSAGDVPLSDPSSFVRLRRMRVRGAELAQRMDDLRREIGPIGVTTSELVREGRRR